VSQEGPNRGCGDPGMAGLRVASASARPSICQSSTLLPFQPGLPHLSQPPSTGSAYLLVKEGPMEGDVVASFRELVEIAAPLPVVWELITDIRRHAEFAGPKSITKVIDFDGPVAVGSRWVAHERFGPQKFDAPSEFTAVEEQSRLEWVSFPPMKDENRVTGGRVIWGYELTPTSGGTRLEHYMTVLEPRKGAASLKVMYKVFGLPAKQVAGGRTTLQNIRHSAERKA
jgi:uncharacterized protein YndB with AHSA1/START domain